MALADFDLLSIVLKQGTRSVYCLLEVTTFLQKTGDVMSANFLSEVPLCSEIVLASF